MAATPPNATLRQTLLDRGENGVRALEFLESAADLLDDPGPRAPQHAAYAIREALKSILKLGGDPPRGMREVAREAVRRWKADRSPERFEESMRQLAAIVDGLGPDEQLLERIVTDLAGIAPTRAGADLLTRFIDVLDEVGRWLHDPAAPPPTAVAGTCTTGSMTRSCRDPGECRVGSYAVLSGAQAFGRGRRATVSARRSAASAAGLRCRSSMYAQPPGIEGSG